MFLFEVIKAFKKEDIKFAVAGGYALALHGIVRATIDVDLIIKLNKSHFKAVEKALNLIGLKSRLPITSEDMSLYKDDYIHNRNLIAWSFIDYKNPSKIVDIIITEDLKKSDFINISVSGTKIPVIKLSKLYKMKKEAGRPKDIADLSLIKAKMNEEKDKL